MACIMQGDLQRNKLKTKCSCAILVSLCSVVNGSLQCKTGPYWPRSHSHKIPQPFGKSKAMLLCSPSRGHSAHKIHIYLTGSGHSPPSSSSISAANISWCRRNTQWTVVEQPVHGRQCFLPPQGRSWFIP